MASVQFIGKENVLSAYDQFDNAQSWGLYDGTKAILYGTGADELEDWLDRFATSGTTAIYTLRVYTESLPVRAATEPLASFKFKLYDPYQGAGVNGNTTKLLDRIGELEKKLDDKDDEGEGEDLLGIVMGWLKQPEKLSTVVGAFQQLMGGDGSAAPAILNGDAMAGYSVQSTDPGDTNDKLERVAAVLDKLEKKDPKLLEHLEKLADLDTITFNLVTGKLDAL